MKLIGCVEGYAVTEGEPNVFIKPSREMPFEVEIEDFDIVNLLVGEFFPYRQEFAQVSKSIRCEFAF